MKNTNILTWVAIGAMLFVGMSLLGNSQQPKIDTMTYSELITAVQQSPATIKEIDITNGSNQVAVIRKQGNPASVVLPTPGGQTRLLEEAGKTNVPVVAAEKTVGFLGTLLAILLSPITFLLIMGWFLWRQMGGGGGGNMLSKLGNSKITVVMPGTTASKTLKDVAGCAEAKEELAEIIEFLRDPKSFREMGAKLTKGVLLIGPPGNGKTLLAKAVAGEASVPFFTMSSSGFVEIFVGKGASTARDLFDQASKNQPCIIFLDEIDAVGRHRGSGGMGGNDEREQTLNEILVRMDGFTENESIVVIAATNRPDTLDPALTRSGRFDLHIQVDAPDLQGREDMFRLHMKGLPIADDVEPAALAKITPGFSGADIASACNQGALVARRRLGGRTKGLLVKLRLTSPVSKDRRITMADLSEGVDRVLGGPMRELRQSDEQRKNTSVHEIGHAGVGHALKGAPVRKVTIVARAKWLGLTLSYKEGDQYNKTRDEMLSEVASAMGGRVAQMEVLGIEDTGAANDFEQATKIARAMVTQFGFSRKLGNVWISDQSTMGGLGRAGGGGGSGANWGPGVLNLVDREVLAILAEATERARKVVQEHRPAFDRLIECLMHKETLLGEEFLSLWNAPVACKCDDVHGDEHKQLVDGPAGGEQSLPADQAVVVDGGITADGGKSDGGEPPAGV